MKDIAAYPVQDPLAGGKSHPKEHLKRDSCAVWVTVKFGVILNRTGLLFFPSSPATGEIVLPLVQATFSHSPRLHIYGQGNRVENFYGQGNRVENSHH